MTHILIAGPLQVVVALATAGTLTTWSFAWMNPCSDPNKAKVDERLLGKWVSQHRPLFNADKAPDPVIITIKKAGGDFPDGILEWSNGKNSSYFFSTPVKEEYYATFMRGRTVSPAKKWKDVAKQAKEEGYTILKYHIDGNELVTTSLDRAAVEQGRIRNFVKCTFKTERRKVGVGEFIPAREVIENHLRVTDTPANIRWYLGKYGASVFSQRQSYLREEPAKEK